MTSQYPNLYALIEWSDREGRPVPESIRDAYNRVEADRLETEAAAALEAHRRTFTRGNRSEAARSLRRAGYMRGYLKADRTPPRPHAEHLAEARRHRA